ncbi:MAG: hypothetical protein KF781_01265 [Chitinophagaceae bacterium]|nr:hypothetical protein [Chitinophagaceae bacterium]MCW5905364.1 hypothetical protein [Chitinophagaceae bacterium]
MKTHILLIASFLFFSFTSIAQDKKAVQPDSIKVFGNCGMCKTTIEKAAKKAGASYASWDENTKILSVKYTTSKTNNAKIQKAIAAAGYDTQDEYATEKAYNSLHACCQYERKEKATVATESKCSKDSASCKKENATCAKDAASCKKDCNHEGTTKDCCKKDKDN